VEQKRPYLYQQAGGERETVAEFYQRCFGEELPESAASISLG